MSFGLLLPVALFALFALLLPVLVHLVRQSEQTRVEFAALRWLTARAQPRRRPRLNEWLLLILRVLLLALVALWLAQPVLSRQPDTRSWVLLHPAIDASRVPPSSNADAQYRWLAPGFPSLAQPAPTASASIGSLLRELDASLPTSVAVTVLVPEQFDATDAQRPLLGRTVSWTPVPGTAAFAATSPQRMLQLAVHVDARHRLALPYLRAAAQSWGSQAKPPAGAMQLREMPAVASLQPADTHLIWLANAPVPNHVRDWVSSGGVLVLAQDTPSTHVNWDDAQVAWRDVDGTALALRTPDGHGQWLRLLVAFNPQSLPLLLEPTFPSALREVLAAAPTATRAHADAYAPIAKVTRAYPPAPQPLAALLALLIALLFGIERWLAASPRRPGAG